MNDNNQVLKERRHSQSIEDILEERLQSMETLAKQVSIDAAQVTKDAAEVTARGKAISEKESRLLQLSKRNTYNGDRTNNDNNNNNISSNHGGSDDDDVSSLRPRKANGKDSPFASSSTKKNNMRHKKPCRLSTQSMIILFLGSIVLIIQMVPVSKYFINFQFQLTTEEIIRRATGNVLEADYSLPTTTSMIGMKPFCQLWEADDALNRTLQPFDMWWTHHPTWVVKNETNEMICLEPLSEESSNFNSQQVHIKDFLNFYAVQFYSTCKKVQWRMNWSSGWSANFLNMQSGLMKSLESKLPLVMGFGKAHGDNKSWNYAANKNDGSNKTCPEADVTCYFLPYHNCGSSWSSIEENEEIELVPDGDLPHGSNIKEGTLSTSAYLFMTREQLWLRRAVFDYIKEFKSNYNFATESESDCTVIHVRRGDASMDSNRRRWFPVVDYVELIPDIKRNDPNHTIFLLTDDHNAISEAYEFYPHLRWKYFNRTRNHGSDGGWQDHTPSQDPALEVIVMFALFQLVQECSTFVHGPSNLVDYIRLYMTLSGREDYEEFHVHQKFGPRWDAKYNSSDAELADRLKELRKDGISAVMEKQSKMLRSDFTPSIQCTADYNSTSVCCNQDNTQNDYAGHVKSCPQAHPI